MRKRGSMAKTAERLRGATMASDSNNKLKERILAAELNPEHVICPMCSEEFIAPGTVAGDRYGVCPACFERGMRDADAAYQKTLKYQTERNRERKRSQRLRDKLGVKSDGRAKEPIF